MSEKRSNSSVISSGVSRSDANELQALFESSRADLKRVVSAKMDARLCGRVDPSDIVQETFLEATKRYQEYLKNPEVPLVEWLRYLTKQNVAAAHRFHLGRQKRAVQRETTIASSHSRCAENFVQFLSGSMTSPHTAAIRTELRNAVEQYLSAMNESDRAILRLRHEEMLSNSQCAERMGISIAAASKRYIRAIQRLRTLAIDYIK